MPVDELPSYASCTSPLKNLKTFSMHSLSTYDASTKVPDTPIASKRDDYDTQSYMTSHTSGTAFLDDVTIHDPRISLPPHLSIIVSEERYDGPVVR